MCGRIRQAREPVEYEESMNWNARDLGNLADGLRYNVPPGTRPLVMHQLGDGSDQIDRLFWGYKPELYKRAPGEQCQTRHNLEEAAYLTAAGRAACSWAGGRLALVG